MRSLNAKPPNRLIPAVMLCLSLFILFWIMVIAYTSGKAIAKAGSQQRISGAIAADSTSLLDALRDAETGQRGFLITGQEPYLEPYNRAVSSIPPIVKRLQQETALRSDQQAQVQELGPLVSAKLEELSKTIQLRRAHGLAAAGATVESGRGKAIMDELRDRIAVINEEATRRRSQYSASADASSFRLRLVSTGGCALLFAFLLSSVVISIRIERRREKLLLLLQTTLASIADAVVVTDTETRVRFLNTVAQQLCGWRENEAIGRRASEVLNLVHEITRQPVPNPLEDALNQGAPVGLANHTVLIRKGGGEITIDDSAAPIILGANVFGAVLVFRDVSEKRRAELELHELSDKLSRSNAELHQFAYAASHDLRSPLNSVQNIAQLLAERYSTELGGEGLELIGYITNGIARMSKLIRDLLAFSEAGNVDDSPTHVPLENALQGALDNLHQEIAKTSASVVMDKLPIVLAHEPSLTQVFQNLIGNAIKYRNTEPPVIGVSAARHGSECVISVQDNGQGFEPEYAEEIFRPFKRLQGQQVEGSGIGLATCRKIIERYGGRIWAESVAGKGSRFSFTLPLAESRGAAGSDLS